jgi:hypothetical protein
VFGVVSVWEIGTGDEQLRALMGEHKALAVDLYGKLQVGSRF